MSATHVDADAWAAVVEASDGDPVNQIAWRQADGPLADRTLWTRNRIVGGHTAAKIVIPLAVISNANNRFTLQQPGGGSTQYVWQQTDTTDAGELLFACQLPAVKGTVDSVLAYVHGKVDSGAAHGGLVGTWPTMTLQKCQLGGLTGSSSVFSTATDTHAALGTYEVDHTFGYSGPSVFSLDIATVGNALYVRMTGENGANKANNKFGIGGVVATIIPA